MKGTIAVCLVALGVGEASLRAPHVPKACHPTTNVAGIGQVSRADRAGLVRIRDHALMDDNGPFLGLGASYFTALRRCKHDRARLEDDLAFLSKCGFNYIRVLSMVGYNESWKGLEIAPIGFTTHDGRALDAWPDYWEQMRALVDLAFDRYGIRTQLTIFADAQLMPGKDARMHHMRTLLDKVVRGREQKILLLEVANEAWQNGFSGEAGVAELRAYAEFLNRETDVLIAISSNHGGPGEGEFAAFDALYRNSSADIATWHFSRDRRTHDGWKPVYDSWEYGERTDCPPASSNEPIGPGSSVDAEKEPIRLVMAAAFAYGARLPMYVFHCEAGVHGRSRFRDTPGIDRYQALLKLLPNDLTAWQRNDGKSESAPFTVFAGGQPNRYWPEAPSARDGCVRNTGSRKGDAFVSLPIGIKPDGLRIEARQALEFEAFDPLTGASLLSKSLNRGDWVLLPSGPGTLILKGRILDPN